MMLIRFGTGALAALLCLSAPARSAPAACLDLPPQKIAFQLFSVRNLVSPNPNPAGARYDVLAATPAQLGTAFAAMRAVGFRDVENVAGSWGHPVETYAGLLKSAGLQAISSHDRLDDPGGWGAVLDRAKALGQSYVGASGFGEPGLDSLEATLKTADNLNRLGKEASARGLTFFVHNHTDELGKSYRFDPGDGKARMMTAWEIVAARTDPRYVKFEVDIHWAWRAVRLDHFPRVLALLRQNRNRIVMLHIKDTLPDGRDTDLGQGMTDWRKIVDAAGPGIAYYIWEYDNPPDPVASAKMAYTFMTCGK